jgi:hypothetical protein
MPVLPYVAREPVTPLNEGTEPRDSSTGCFLKRTLCLA